MKHGPTNPAGPAGIAVIALTRPGGVTACKLAAALGLDAPYLPGRLRDEATQARWFDEPVAELIRKLWKERSGFFLVMAAGIAVRSIAPLLESKKRDPAVIVLDPLGNFAVPILSGHLGGANHLSELAAGALGGQAVITTGTDAVGKPAVEVWAHAHGHELENPEAVVTVNAAWVNSEPVALYVDPALSAGATGLEGEVDLLTTSLDELKSFEGAAVVLSHKLLDAPSGALLVRPKALSIGVGCRKAAGPPGRVAEEITDRIRERGFSPLSVAAVATIDVKAAEPALIELAGRLGLSLTTYPAEELVKVAAPNPSERVRRAVGTPSVAEPSAILASGGGELVAEKSAGADWTLAIARCAEH